MRELDVDDAAAAFAAIVRAHPGGLGEAPEHDVRAPARVSLREAMAAAAHRDSIASEYATGYAIVFDTGLPLLAEALGDGAPTLDAIVSLHVGLLAARPDTLIARKAGDAAARAVTAAAREVRAGTRSLERVRRLAARSRQPAQSRYDRRPRGGHPARRAADGGDAAVRVLVVAVSARMLAQLAVADGYDVIALDRFGDVDLRAVAPGATAPSSDALAALAAGIEADAVVYGAGFENRPDLVARLADGRELLGTPPELLAAVRDPWAVGAAARAAGARAPETRPAMRDVRRRRGRPRGVAAQAAAGRRRARRTTVGGRPAGADARSSSAGSTDCRARRWRSATGVAPPCSASPSSCIAGRGSGGWAT